MVTGVIPVRDFSVTVFPFNFSQSSYFPRMTFTHLKINIQQFFHNAYIQILITLCVSTNIQTILFRCLTNKYHHKFYNKIVFIYISLDNR